MRLRLLVALTLALGLGQQVRADSVFGYSLGVSLQNTVVPGSLVTMDAILLNTGTLPIVFAPSFPGGTPSAQGGSVPFGAVSADGQWSILGNGFAFGNFAGQFAGVIVAPGAEFQFSIGTFQAPANQPLGTSAMPQINFGIDFTDTIEGNLSAVCPGACTYNNPADPSFTLGAAPGSSGITFFQGVVVDNTPVPVPEPAAWELLGITGIAMAGSLRRLRSRA
jgi:hypothetical protein